MTNKGKVLEFFLAANTPKGFYSRFDQLYNLEGEYRVYIIKGGPGTGKSSLIKSCAAAAVEKGIDTELIYCSSDPDSLDGAVFDSLGCCIADGTSPHSLEPKYPGAVETIVDIGSCWDENILANNRREIIKYFTKNKEIFDRAYSFLAAAACISKDTMRIVDKAINYEKIKKSAAGLVQKEIKPKKGASAANPRERVRFLSGITPKGIVFYQETINKLCDRLIVFEDEFGLASGSYLSHIRAAALERGYDIYSCYCPTEPESRLEHIIIPELGIGFCSSNKYHPIELPYYRKIRSRRFISQEILSVRKNRLAFNRKAYQEMIEAAVDQLKKAKLVHDKLEGEYKPGMDYNKVNMLSNKISKQIISRRDKD